MGMIKEFHYPNLSQRKILVYNTFFSFALLGCLLGNLLLLGNYYFFYQPVSTVLFFSGLTGFLGGNYLGKSILSRSEKFRWYIIGTNLLFVVLGALYLLRNVVAPSDTDAIIRLYVFSPWLLGLSVLLIAGILGMKFNYALKISCGDFIDNRQFISGYIGNSIIGFSLGMVIAGIHYFLELPAIFMMALPTLLLPSMFLINLPYNPLALYAKDFEGDRDDRSHGGEKTQILLVYLNYSFIVLYLFLGFATIIRFLDNPPLTKMVLIIVAPLVLLCGFILGRLIRLSWWHIYGQAAFPLLFVGFIAGVFTHSGKQHIALLLSLFIPSLLAFGFVLNHTVRSVVSNYNHDRRFQIIEFAHILLPIPIIVALVCSQVSSIWFFIVVGSVGIANVLVPAYFLRKRDAGSRLLVPYAIGAGIFLPLLIFVVAGNRIPLTGSPYVFHVEHFNEVLAVSASDYFVKNRALIRMDREPVFDLSDSEVRNLKRALTSVALYHQESDSLLVIDGYRRFIRNPVIDLLPATTCLDPLTAESVDFNRLPEADAPKTPVVTDNILGHFRTGARYNIIVDMPNLLDQNRNVFRFSREYYRIVQDHLTGPRIFVQVISATHCRPELIAETVKNLSGAFKHSLVWYFSSIIVIMSSNEEGALTIRPAGLSRLSAFISRNPSVSAIFVNEIHLISHILTTKLNELLVLSGTASYAPLQQLGSPSAPLVSDAFIDRFVNTNNGALALADRSPDAAQTLVQLQNTLANTDAVLTLLKKTEYAESMEEYDRETSLLFDLRKRADYQPVIKEYINTMFVKKEEYYFAAALRYERIKKWENARELYRAVITLNNNNFDAYYRMGLLSITIQDLDNAAGYLQEAMRIKKDHPKVLYQMGVLNFSRGNIKDAIDYFTRANQLNENNASLYRYLGLCHEQNGNKAEAERWYEKTLEADPGDTDIKARLAALRSGKEKEKGKWEKPDQKNESDVEQDAEMPLPINKAAKDQRIRDDDTSLPLMGDEGNPDDADAKTSK